MERLDRTQPSYKALVRSSSKREDSPTKSIRMPLATSTESELVPKNLKALEDAATKGPTHAGGEPLLSSIKEHPAEEI